MPYLQPQLLHPHPPWQLLEPVSWQQFLHPQAPILIARLLNLCAGIVFVESPVVEDELGGLSICEADAGYLYFVWLALCSQGHIIIIHRHDDTVFERPIARTPWRKTEDEMPKSKQRSIASGNTHRTCICA